MLDSDGLRTCDWRYYAGIVFLGNRRVEAREFPDPVPTAGEAVVRVRASGLCGSDFNPFRAPQATDSISGHEPCGEVEALGSGSAGARVGDRVIVYHYSGCGTCKYCRTGWEQLCSSGRKTYGFGSNGGNADYILVPARTLVPLPDELSFEEGAAIACGTGTAYGAMLRLAVSGRDTLAVFGQGPVGLSATLLAKAMGARVIAVDISPERLDFARELGADHTVNSKDTDPLEAIRDLTHGEGADAAVDCTGNADARAQMVRCVRIFGSACFVGEGGNRHPECQPGRHQEAADDLRILDVQRGDARGVRQVRRRPAGTSGPPDHPPLPT